MSILNNQSYNFNPLCDIIINESKDQVAILHPLKDTWIKISFDAYNTIVLLSTSNIFSLRKKGEIGSDSEIEFKKLGKYLLEKEYLVTQNAFEELSKIDVVMSYRNMLKSKLHTVSKRVYLSLTSSCNLKCIHCYNTVKKPNIEYNNDITIYNVLERMKGNNIYEIILTGGEPFLRSDIFEIIKKASEITKRIRINTNGLLINNDTVQSLKEYDDLIIAVSLDGLTKRTHEKIRGENTYDDTLAIINTLIKNGITTHVISTITKINYKELVYFDDFIKDLGVTGNLSYYTPVGTGKNSVDQLLMDNESIEDYRKLLFEKNKNNNLEHSDSDKLQSLPIKFNCSAGIGVLGIEDTGRVVPCHLFLGKEISLGNILSENLPDMQNKWIDNGLMSVDQNGECKKCSIRHFCGNGCFANTFYNSTIYAKDPNCNLYQYGLNSKLWKCNN